MSPGHILSPISSKSNSYSSPDSSADDTERAVRITSSEIDMLHTQVSPSSRNKQPPPVIAGAKVRKFKPIKIKKDFVIVSSESKNKEAQSECECGVEVVLVGEGWDEGDVLLGEIIVV